MATITTGIQLADNFSAPLMHIISSVNMAISSIYDMDQAMNAGVNTASLEAARNEIAQATVAAEEFNQTMQQASSPINDNIRRQEQFNQSLQNGASESSNLVSAIKRMAGAYLSIQTAGKTAGGLLFSPSQKCRSQCSRHFYLYSIKEGGSAYMLEIHSGNQESCMNAAPVLFYT